MRTTLGKAVRAFTGRDIPEHSDKPLALRLVEYGAALAAIVWMTAMFLALEPTP